MRKAYKSMLIAIIIFSTVYLSLGYLSSYIGWYGYKKWKYRVATTSIEDSKKRGVFVKELKFSVDSFSGPIGDLQPYIEKGFKYGLHSSEKTVPLTGSNYPYQLSFNFNSSAKMGLLIKESELKKFDSFDMTNGYLKNPELKDTIIIDIAGENIHSGVIKVYQ